MFISNYLTYFDVVSLDLFLSISIYIYLYLSIYVYIHLYPPTSMKPNHEGKSDYFSMDQNFGSTSEASFAS